MGIVKGNFPGGLQVIELRAHPAAEMDIPTTSMTNTRRIPVHLGALKIANALI